ncbi:PLP-dependent cysteine synthase family protein [Bacillus sp. B1-b2]|uniref:PLP-dependent cysteine synthase family protein n=1 Tax=Bacillus sp. B1-b2 TaxID=2653201 RepID=UPI001261CDA2|nr:cysteine synthase family protein [Bacillus sp. B1-b2]KAB7667262.1 cysteine synthase family protein [Bacillus sp. B1-b2]
MKVYDNVHQMIGNTPMIEITQFPIPEYVRIFAKLEYYNPGGSIKDRLGYEFIQNAIIAGKLKAEGTIIEPTAGNTGIGLALAAIKWGVKVIVCVPQKFSIEKQEIMKALGAEVIHTPTELGMKGAMDKAKELHKKIPNSYIPGQFENRENPDTYYKTLGPEIWEQLDKKLDVFVAGAGTGGTFMGTAKYLKEQNQLIRTVIVEPEGSILNGGESGSHKTEGIGMEFLPSYMETDYFDAIHTVSDEDAFSYVKQVALKEGLLIGSSSGAALYAALTEAKQAYQETNIVVVFPDSSDRYMSKRIFEGGI